MKKIISLISFVLVLSFFSIIKIDNVKGETEITVVGTETTSSITVAQEDSMTDSDKNLDIDLNVDVPIISPGHWAYGIKHAWQNLRIALTFKPIKKAMLRMNYLNSDLAGINAKIQKINGADKQNHLIKIYQKNSEELEKLVEKIKEEKKLPENTNQFLTLLSKNQLKHIVVLNKLEDKLPQQAAQRIAVVKERQIERMIDKIDRLKDKEIINKMLNKISNSKHKPNEKIEQLKQQIKERQKIIENLTPLQRKRFSETLKNTVNNALRKQIETKKQIQNRIKQQDVERDIKTRVQQSKTQNNYRPPINKQPGIKNIHQEN